MHLNVSICSAAQYLRRFDIRVGHSRNWKDNALCHYHKPQVPDGVTKKFSCDNYVQGRYVSVSKGGQLTICEAVVHGYVAGEYEGFN